MGIAVSVIVPVHRAENFEHVLVGWEMQDMAHDLYWELIVVVTGEWNAVSEMIGEHPDGNGCTVIEHNALGLGNCRARNEGAAMASGERLLFVDGDCVPCDDVVNQHAGASGLGLGICNIELSRPADNVVVALPRSQGKWQGGIQTEFTDYVRFVNGITLNQAVGFAMFHNPNWFGDCINCVTRNVSVPREWFIANGGFDTNLEYSPESPSRGWEDLELGLRWVATTRYGHGDCVPAWTAHIHHENQYQKDNGLLNIARVMLKHPWFMTQRPEWFEGRYDIAEVKRVMEQIRREEAVR